MKKIGLLFGIEQTFSPAVIDSINNRKIPNLSAEILKVGATRIDDATNCNVIFDRVSNEVPFYRSILKLAVLNGVKVINPPFWDCFDDKFFLFSLSASIGIKVPNTAVLPCKEHPPGTNSETMRNLEYPIDWDKVFYYVGFPSYIKPNHQNSFQNMFKVYNSQEFFSAYDLTGNKHTLLQESIEYDEYYRCFVIGDRARVMFYNPEKPLNQRYISGEWKINPEMESKIAETGIKFSSVLNLDFNVMDFAVRDNEIYAVELFNPMANSDKEILHADNFKWVVENTADLLVSKALERKKPSNINSIADLFQSAESKPLLIPKPPGKKRGRPKKIN
ncbi:MAG: hypothetical protein EPN82_11780 [Bacteroidetes bacterium]|nr:MAG: hypothetical protein EPN82_11780 [Bacteroidota bacterium]